MIDSHMKEIEGYRLRLMELEAAEVGRLAQETAHKEELFNNHGKPKSYF